MHADSRQRLAVMVFAFLGVFGVVIQTFAADTASDLVDATTTTEEPVDEVEDANELDEQASEAGEPDAVAAIDRGVAAEIVAREQAQVIEVLPAASSGEFVTILITEEDLLADSANDLRSLEVVPEELKSALTFSCTEIPCPAQSEALSSLATFVDENVKQGELKVFATSLDGDQSGRNLAHFCELLSPEGRAGLNGFQSPNSPSETSGDGVESFGINIVFAIDTGIQLGERACSTTVASSSPDEEIPIADPTVDNEVETIDSSVSTLEPAE